MKPKFEQYREHLQTIIQAALAAANPATAVTDHLHKNGRVLHMGEQAYDLDQGRVFLVSVGKASVPMALAAANVLAEDLSAGLVIAKKGGRNGAAELGHKLLPSVAEGGEQTVAIGPEAGFSSDEIPSDSHRFGLGSTTLRVETAAIAAAVLVLAGSGRLDK